ncbi:type I iodothyronine deiodinase [Podarcis lilfordi]|uniref:Type I iodothyronine deiodinase n=1 Tax=Podarcis lilfordi TaxID=74358 RepID=A0AA35KHV9_9SAUR|nr:type I iodothyronine deiodinase [Podarcis lilfordi]
MKAALYLYACQTPYKSAPLPMILFSDLLWYGEKLPDPYSGGCPGWLSYYVVTARERKRAAPPVGTGRLIKASRFVAADVWELSRATPINSYREEIYFETRGKEQHVRWQRLEDEVSQGCPAPNTPLVDFRGEIRHILDFMHGTRPLVLAFGSCT